MDQTTGELVQQPGSPAPAADTNKVLIRLWLHGCSTSIQDAYRGDLHSFLAHAGLLLRGITLGNLQGYADSLAGLKPANQTHKLATLKNLFVFGHRLGLLSFDIGGVLRPPSFNQCSLVGAVTACSSAVA